MKSRLRVLQVVAVLLVAVLASPAMANGRGHGHGHGHRHGHSHSHFGFYFGGPLFWPAYPAPVYYPPVVVRPAPPPVYIEQASPQASAAPNAGNSWYYCADSRAYYPYVKDCAVGWQRVAPLPAGQ